MISYYKDRIGYAEDIIIAARKLGYEDSHIIISTARQEIEYSQVSLMFFQDIENKFIQRDLIWKEKEKEYPVATAIWSYLKECGYNDYVCAGILGNMMAEVGGGTFNLQWDIISSDGGFYGVCQWNWGHENVWGKDLLGQLKYLSESIEREMNMFGYAYKKDFNYNQFLEMEDERAAALAFATCYERCARQYRAIRQDYAELAYEYFVLEVNQNG